jgi:two-component system sensor histidine kinase BaeS
LSRETTSWSGSVRIAGRAALAFIGALAVALLLAQILLAPTRGDMVELAEYLALSGVATVAASVLLTRLLERHARLTLLGRFVLVTAVAAAVLLANIVVLARLMFISTDHDLQVLLSAAIFGAIVSIGFAVWASYGPLAQLAEVNRSIRELAAGRVGALIEAPGDDEIALLARDVDVLSRRLAEAEAERASLDAERRELTAAISHDLRTPLSTISAMVDAIADGVVREPVDTKRYLATIRRDIGRLNRMIDDLFDLAQVDAGVMKLERRPVALDEVVGEVVAAMRARAQRAGVSLSFSIKREPPAAMLDGDRLERAVANLLRNALEHTPSGGEIHVTLDSSGGQAVVDVSDSGEGIAAQDLPHIWTRFYRAERSRARADANSDGVGLGLAITKAIVELHGGRVEVRSTPGKGTDFEVLLPLSGS